MSEIDKVQLAKEKLMDLGISGEVAATLAETIIDGSNPSVNSHAQGGRGGHAINLTYVDNYSTLMLVYTFLLNSLDNKDDSESSLLNKSLLTTLQTVINEQQKYRDAFLEAIRNLNKY
ncbi:MULTISPECIES: hypothetical protein [Heyndrickxia]|uniref:Uncharacterized protein n=3 Tax=Heyndrickxia sporothermodurans TaxID=46224 RepID=A0A150L3P7_9BACI|nr:hypothetical protein [Heyndrickxia sporothermodurans]KYD06928.1 hypothetical protein B4102_3011 [Heyndrickxia sporothermodurans]MBL5766827.1 hypothetical protein [Heyndrickxia sporothermodurans]MBL5771393.1 hypothetical protein [Heyndrickxia sporothermodurans]MBL5774137.1 hypothetical protein [Heyndrickxia sporothermodurans]MBL5777554.1 hypothetical protein [Heyndrickxia sporothermodurans]